MTRARIVTSLSTPKLISLPPPPGNSFVQDGSPHGRPAGRASLAGAARAVRAAGLVPVGVCNTSHDVLKLALEHGLPEVSALCLGCVAALFRVNGTMCPCRGSEVMLAFIRRLTLMAAVRYACLGGRG